MLLGKGVPLIAEPELRQKLVLTQHTVPPKSGVVGLEYKVVFFRDQTLDAKQQMSFARRFGELESHPFLDASDDHDQIVRFEKNEKTKGAENLWHSDVSWRLEPSLGSVLRCILAPPVGGDTLFCDMVAAYDGLSDELKERIDDLCAIHDFTHSFGRALKGEALKVKQKEFPPARHPVARTHPETGKKILYVNRIFASHIEGVDRRVVHDNLGDSLFVDRRRDPHPGTF